ncbi:hypothetical protein F7725_009481 [Dissostichus mawsoni]|uniref:Uncharacterized protein n=1 Tax=Dissostichus mawsoni TaxID=36200 RepID=A0A7J5XLI3_DISMA|nr:hypothetical protein F7725_009481 [Dissostichus mawsoni]
MLSRSSEESDFPIPLSDATHYESSDVQSDDDDGDKDLSDGDFVIVKENDEGVIPRGDVLKKLPTPQKLGGTARREYKFTFPCSIDKWDVQ